jgi:uncharacterized protein YigE (DUF2233 family)
MTYNIFPNSQLLPKLELKASIQVRMCLGVNLNLMTDFIVSSQITSFFFFGGGGGGGGGVRINNALFALEGQGFH